MRSASTNVRIPGERIIGPASTGFETAAARAWGVAPGVRDHALGYAKQRQQFGKWIAEFQGLQLLLADMGMKVEAERQMTYAAAGVLNAAMQT